MAVTLANKTVKQPHLENLRNRHQALSNKIEKEYRNLACSDIYIRQLKVEKLKLKEEIQNISGTA